MPLKAASDPLGLYDLGMGSDTTSGGVTRNGVSGSCTCTVMAGFANKPVNYVARDVLRVANGDGEPRKLQRGRERHRCRRMHRVAGSLGL